MEAQPPNVDLLTWVFGNGHVKEEDLIYIDADKTPPQQPKQLEVDQQQQYNRKRLDQQQHQEETQKQQPQQVPASLRKGQLRTLVRQLVAGFKSLNSVAASASAPVSAAAAAPSSASASASAAAPCSTAPPNRRNHLHCTPSSQLSAHLKRQPTIPFPLTPPGSNSNSYSPFGDGTNPLLDHVDRPQIRSDSHPLHFSPLVVCVHSFNNIIYPALFLGVVGAGGQWTGSNPAYTVGELSHHLKISKSTHVITGPECLETAVMAARECGIPLTNLFLLTPTHAQTPPVVRCWTELLQYGESDWITFNDESRAKSTSIALFSTSGTTGLPKMAERSHHSFVAESFALRDMRPKSYKASRLISVPMFHAFASALGLVSALRDGCPTFVMPRFSRPKFLEALHNYQITETALVPPLLLAFLQYTTAEQAKLSTLHSVWCGGSPLDTVTQGKALQLFAPGARIVQVWGMTEAGWITTFRYPEADNTGSVGRLIPGYQARCVDEWGNDVVSEEAPGEILVKGPMLMRGYLGDIQATRNTIDEDGWLHSGDIGFIRQGKVYIVDRKKELIKVRGWQIAPAELEGILLMHSDIVDAAVIGITRPEATTEIPRAYVVLSPGSPLQKADIKAFLLQHLARYKVCDCDILFRNIIPKSVSGKILRKVLRAEFADELAREAASMGKNRTENATAWSSPEHVASSDVLLLSQFAVLLHALFQLAGATRLWQLLANAFGVKHAR